MIWVLVLLGLQVSPELVQHVNAGLAAKRAGDLRTAIVEFEKAAELAPGLAAAHVNLGAVYFEHKDYGLAVVSLRKALALNSNLPGALGMLGAALLAQGYAAEAIAHLEKGQVEDLLGVALLETGREREAVDRLEAALLKRPEDEDLLYYLSQAHGRLARQVGEKLTGQFGETARAKQMLGEAYAGAGNKEAAVSEFRAALAARPELLGVHLALGELFRGGGDLESAEREFGAEVKLAPGSAEAAFRLGSVLLNRGDAAGALRELERAERLKPGMPENLLELGRAQAESGAMAAAEKSFLQVLAAEREGSLAESAHFQLSQLYRKMKWLPEAEKEMSAFRELRGKRQGRP